MPVTNHTLHSTVLRAQVDDGGGGYGDGDGGDQEGTREGGRNRIFLLFLFRTSSGQGQPAEIKGRYH